MATRKKEKQFVDLAATVFPVMSKIFVVLAVLLGLGTVIYITISSIRDGDGGQSADVPKRSETPSQMAQPSKGIPLASEPQSTWSKWVIPPGGKSERNVSPPGMHLVASGSNFKLHAVYPDGHECSFGQKCENASQIINYATSEANETITVYFAFAPN